MAGVRVHHSSEINCVFVLVDASRPYREPFVCPPCEQTHLFKTYHINLDGEGFAIVSPEIWAKLQRIPAQPFEMMNEVSKPPPIIIAPGFAGVNKIVGLDGKEIRSA